MINIFWGGEKFLSVFITGLLTFAVLKAEGGKRKAAGAQSVFFTETSGMSVFFTDIPLRPFKLRSQMTYDG